MTFELQGEMLVESVVPTRGRPYVHRCSIATFERVCHEIDERFVFTLQDLVAAGLPSTQAATALRFLHEWGLLERTYPRRNQRTESSVYLSAMVCLHGMADATWGD